MTRFLAAILMTTMATPAWAGWTTLRLGGLSTDVYTPSTVAARGQGRGLFIALHGCTQTKNDLRTRDDLDTLAEEHGWVIAIPAEPSSLLGCYSYYGSNHSRSSGIAGSLLTLTQSLTSNTQLDIDPRQVYIGGLSAGASMAQVMGCVAPDVYAGVVSVAGPAVGTDIGGAFSVTTGASQAQAVCENLAGNRVDELDRQLAVVVAGTSDFTVPQAYRGIVGEMYRGLYGLSSQTRTLGLNRLPGLNPAGTVELWSDAAGPRIASLNVQGLGHAWPAGVGSGPEIGFVSPGGLDLGGAVGIFFDRFNRRLSGAPAPTPDPDPDPMPTPDPVPDPDPAPTGCAVSVVDDTLNGHIPRYDVYAAGWGLADTTYVDLQSTFGLNEFFEVYESSQGDWYLEESSVPCP